MCDVNEPDKIYWRLTNLMDQTPTHTLSLSNTHVHTNTGDSALTQSRHRVALFLTACNTLQRDIHLKLRYLLELKKSIYRGLNAYSTYLFWLSMTGYHLE